MAYAAKGKGGGTIPPRLKIPMVGSDQRSMVLCVTGENRCLQPVRPTYTRHEAMKRLQGMFLERAHNRFLYSSGSHWLDASSSSDHDVCPLAIIGALGVDDI